MDSIRGPILWQNGPKLNGTLGRDWPGGLGEKPEPKGMNDPSVQLQKIQIALSLYHSILAQVALRTTRLSTPHRHILIPLARNLHCRRQGNLPQQHRHHTHGLSLGPAHSRKTLALLSALAPLAVGIIPRFTISMSQEEKKHLEPEGKEVRVTAGDH